MGIPLAFSSPAYTFRVAYSEVSYGSVQGRIIVHPIRGHERDALVEIPTEVFLLVETLFSKAQQEEGKRLGITHYCEEQPDGRWVLGIAITGGSEYIDLWSYPANALPPWLHKALN